MNNNKKLNLDDAIQINKSNGKTVEPEDISKQAAKSEKPSGKKKGARGKEKEIEKLRKEVDEWRDKYLRQVAEFENFRKRKEREVEEFWKVANADLIKKLLPILDDIERSLASAQKDRNFDALAAGIELVYKSFLKILEGEGVTQISAKGQEFNPEVHEALMQIEKEGVASNVVVDEHQKGYLLGEKILRPAKVVVSK